MVAVAGAGIRMTQEFIVSLEPRPGTLAEVLRKLKEKNVNIEGVVAYNVGEFDTLRFLADKPRETEAALRAASLRYRQFEVVKTRVPDRPGGLLIAAEKLSSSGVNIQALYTLGSMGDESEVAFRVDDIQSARKALGP